MLRIKKILEQAKSSSPINIFFKIISKNNVQLFWIFQNNKIRTFIFITMCFLYPKTENTRNISHYMLYMDILELQCAVKLSSGKYSISWDTRKNNHITEQRKYFSGFDENCLFFLEMKLYTNVSEYNRKKNY